jgi:2,3-bisphosphoglycerate-independent phosphoglycerate mutase
MSSAASASRPKPVVIIVRDGWGRNPHPEHDQFNAVKLARTPRCDALLKTYPWTLIHTSGRDVGLPSGTMGNSEVGHQNLGAGRIVNQESTRITVAIEDGSFFVNPAFAKAIARVKASPRAKLHLLGIASDAGVHGLLEHLYACVEAAKRGGLTKDRVCLHLFTDGRDTGPYTGKGFIAKIEEKLHEIGVGRIVSIVGRYYVMDRDNRWERVKKAYDLLTGAGEAPMVFPTAAAALQAYYDQPTNDSQQGDEFITPRVIGNDWKDTRIASGGSVIFYNYRGDRPREITRAFMQSDFEGNVKPSPDSGRKGFDRSVNGEKQLDLCYVCMTQYDETFDKFPKLEVAFRKPPKMADIGGQFLADHGLTQFRCAETEKFPHVTFFFNDYREEPFPGETREMAQSPKVATYDLQPEMSAPEITKLVLERVNAADCPDFILVNFANGDMVGHTGKLEAAIKAVETVDGCVGQIVDAVLARSRGGGKLIVTADHGNAEQMFDLTTNAPHTAHTTYAVECILVADDLKSLAGGSPEVPSDHLRKDGRLADVFPTALKMLGLSKPQAMTGQSLV